MSNVTCAVETCDRSAVARGWCHTHWDRWKRLGDVLADKPIRGRTSNKPRGTVCGVQGCDRSHVARGLCSSHYSRWIRHGDLLDLSPIVAYAAKDVPCAVQECCETAVRRSYCWKHYYRLLRTGGVDLKPLTEEVLEERRSARRLYHREWKRAEYARNPDPFRGRVKAAREANPELSKLRDAAKRRQRRQAPRVPFSAEALGQKIAYWGARCWICKAPWEAVDHVKPIAKGGWDVLSNLRPICTSCNSKKHDRWPYPIAV